MTTATAATDRGTPVPLHGSGPVTVPLRPGVTHYVAGFLFSEDRQVVALVEKQKPAWQAGKLNAIGGKIEPGETPLKAMHREFAEETGVQGIYWYPTAVLEGRDGDIHFFHAFDQRVFDVRTMEEEVVLTYRVDSLALRRLMKNLPVLIALALDDSGIQRPVWLFDGRAQPAPKAA